MPFRWFLPSYVTVVIAAIAFSLFSSSRHTMADGLGVPSPEQFRVAEGFRVDLVHEVTEGSWVCMTLDPKGRLIACDQYGGLYRISLDEESNAGTPTKVEKLNSQIQGAQGLLCAFGSLYANVNSNEAPSGVWRLTDTDGRRPVR